MSLLEIRTKFRQLSGHYELVNSDYSDNGADFFINQGQKFLDSRQESPKSIAWQFYTLSQGDKMVTVNRCRAVKEVWVYDSSDGRFRLEKLDRRKMMEEYSNPSDVDEGRPYYYSLGIIGLSPDQLTLTKDQIDAFDDSDEIYTSGDPATNADHWAYGRVLFMPPADQEYTMKLLAYWFSPDLASDADKSFWTEVYPDALLYSAFYKLELRFSNMTRARHWLTAVEQELANVDSDVVEEGITDIRCIEG